jgi:alkylation response protein AidB-like acyl-CoA dehydrogenase
MSAAPLSAVASPPAAAQEPLPRIRALVASDLRPRVREIDEAGAYPRDLLQKLGEAGAFTQHQTGSRDTSAPDLGAAVEAMAIIGEECLATAFCAWCQDALGWYIENTANPELKARLQQPVADGALLGGTGLSNPMKALSGIENLRLRGQRTEGGWLVSGTLPWVSNLGEGHPFGICFAAEDGRPRLVMAVARCGDAGVVARQSAHFIALEGTATMSVTFRDAFIPDAMILADPAEPMIRRIRAGFILLQTGMALGLVRGSIAQMRETETVQNGVNAHLPDRPDDLAGDGERLAETIHALAATPFETDAEYLRSVLQARLRGSELALAAAQSAMLYAGARGYLRGSAASRRLREAYFIAIVTPAMKHLRKDIAALASNGAV